MSKITYEFFLYRKYVMLTTIVILIEKKKIFGDSIPIVTSSSCEIVFTL